MGEGEKPRVRPRVDLRAETDDDEAHAPPPAPAPSPSPAPTPAPQLSEPPRATSDEVNSLRADLAFAQIEIASLKDALSKAEKAIEKSAPASGVGPSDSLARETKARTKAEDRAALGDKVVEGLRVELEVARATLGETKVAHAKELAERDARMAMLKVELEALRERRPPARRDAATSELTAEDIEDLEALENPEADEASNDSPASTGGPRKPKVDISALLAAAGPPEKSSRRRISPATWFKILAFVAVGLIAYQSREPVLGFIARTREAPHVYATRIALANLASAVQAEANGAAMQPDDFDRLLDGYAKKSESLAKDPWGTRYRLDSSPYALRSAGPDQQYDTEDDLVLDLSGAPTAPAGAPSP